MCVNRALWAGVLFLSVASGARADVIAADSVIASVVVYPDAGRVTRKVQVDLKEGPQTIVFKGVKPLFDENSLSVAGAGSAAVKILGAGVKSSFLKEPVDERVRALQAKIQAIDDLQAGLQGETLVLEQKKAFLDSVKLFTDHELPKEIASKVPTVDELKALLSFIEEGVKEYTLGQQAVVIKEREKSNERQALVDELEQLQGQHGRWEKSVNVDVECLRAGKLTLELSYTTGGVSWRPVYDARVSFDKSMASLSAFALVRQTTGDDWHDVALTLSTARASVGGVMPEIMSVWYLTPWVTPRPRHMMDKAMSARASMETMAADNLMAGNMPAAAPLMEEKALVAYAQADFSGAAIIYKPAHPVTVKSDGSEVRVPLLVQDLTVSFEYAATPKLSSFVYLKSEVQNGTKDQLLAGAVNVFLDDAYVGASRLPKTMAPSEKFDLFLGVDESVSIRRDLVEDKTDDTLIGGIPSPTKKHRYVYKLTAESHKPKTILFKVFDQIPVAQDDKIKVAKGQFSVKPDTDRYKDREGVCLWTLSLNPGEKKEITYSYEVESPRDMVVSGL